MQQPMGISQNRPKRDLGVPIRRLNEIIHGKRVITADTALRLARYFGTSHRFLIGYQSDYDLGTAENGLSEKIAYEVKSSRSVKVTKPERMRREV